MSGLAAIQQKKEKKEKLAKVNLRRLWIPSLSQEAVLVKAAMAAAASE